MLPSPVPLLAVLVLGLAMAGVAGCGDDDSSDRQLDSTPTKQDGTESQEFELTTSLELRVRAKRYGTTALAQSPRRRNSDA